MMALSDCGFSASTRHTPILTVEYMSNSRVVQMLLGVGAGSDRLRLNRRKFGGR
jgi:hypothetical protein